MLRTSKRAGLAGCALFLSATAGLAEVTVKDAYARASTAMSTSGAAFMVIENSGTEDDRLIAIKTPAAERAELHTHEEDAHGVMRMMEVEEGFVIPAGGHHALQRGGDHVMLLGLSAPMTDGDSLPMVLVFETAGEVAVDVPVDLARQPMAHGGEDTHDHGDHDHGDHEHGSAHTH